jgi:carbon monoxide dehydrogenase subunit G
LPGCESLERVDESTWKATVAAKIGPVSARFSGTMKIVESTLPTATRCASKARAARRDCQR